MDIAESIASDDRSYLYGDGLFETVRLRPSGEVRWLDDHVARLESSGRALGFDPGLIARGVSLLRSLTSSSRAPGIWRVTVSRGAVDGHGRPAPFGGIGGVSLRFRPYNPPSRPHLTLAGGFYLPDDILAEHKTTSYLRSIEVRRRAQIAGFDDAIMTSPGGLVGEASSSNVVVIRGGKAFTPIARGILAGVTRKNLLALAAAAGFPIEIREVNRAELESADEMVLLSAGVGFLPAASFEGRSLDDSWTRRARGWLEAAIH